MKKYFVDLEFPKDLRDRPISSLICELTILDEHGRIVLNTPVNYTPSSKVTQHTLNFFKKTKEFYLRGIKPVNLSRKLAILFEGAEVICWGTSDKVAIDSLFVNFGYKVNYTYTDVAKIVSQKLDIKKSLGLKLIARVMGYENVPKSDKHSPLDDTRVLRYTYFKVTSKKGAIKLINAKEILADEWLRARFTGWGSLEDRLVIAFKPD